MNRYKEYKDSGIELEKFLVIGMLRELKKCTAEG